MHLHAGPQEDTAREDASGGPSRRLFTLPNLLCFVRLIGSIVMIGLALWGEQNWFVALFVFLAMTDWVDGKLAILLNQRSIYGARLDSAADVSLYTALTLGGLWLSWDTLRDEIVWIAAAVLSYVVSAAVAVWKFGRLPSYHTRAAKTSWFLVLVGSIAVLLDWAVWPFRLAMAVVVLTNIETTIISLVVDEWQADVTSLYHVRRRQTRAGEAEGSRADGSLRRAGDGGERVVERGFTQVEVDDQREVI
jgi:CDP-diacylglycerol--glycerol-3-phosphate 3-phosphatidyltransferase